MKLLCIFFLWFFFSLSSLTKASNSALLNLNNKTDLSDLSILANDVARYQIFFIGENHIYLKSNTDFILKLLKYLNQDSLSVKNILFELGHSSSVIMNEYIVNGNTTIRNYLKNVTDSAFIDYLDELKKINDHLTNTDKVRMHGIDIERDLSLSYKALNLLLPKNTTYPKVISSSIETILGMGTYLERNHKKEDNSLNNLKNLLGNQNSFYNLSATMQVILDNFEENERDFESYLGGNFESFKHIMTGAKKYRKWLKYSNANAYQFWVLREQYMAEQIEHLIEKKSNEKFIGTFGRCHSFLNIPEQSECGFYSFKSLANRIADIKVNDSSNLNILSIGTYYPSFHINPKTKLLEVNTIQELSNAVAKNEIRLFKVDTSAKFNSTRDLFDYVIVNKKRLEDEINDISKSKENYSLYDYYYFTFGLDFTNFNNPSFNENLINAGYLSLSNPIFLKKIAFKYHSNKEYFQAEFRFNHSFHKHNSLDDQTIKLSLQDFTLGYFYKTTGNIFYLALGSKFGGGRFRVEENIMQVDINQTFPVISNSNWYRNYFTFSPEVQLVVNYKNLSIGLNAGYQLDWAKGILKNADGNTLDDSFRYSVNTLYFGFSSGLYFN